MTFCIIYVIILIKLKFWKGGKKMIWDEMIYNKLDIPFSSRLEVEDEEDVDIKKYITEKEDSQWV